MKKLFIIVFGLIAISFSTSCITTVRPAHTRTVVVKVAPKNHRIVYVKGKRYYFWNGKHHRKTKNGYIIVKM